MIQYLDNTGEFDFLFPFDCDEFLILRIARGFTSQKDTILRYLETLKGEVRPLRIPYQLANNPFEEDFYIHFGFKKTFFARDTFEHLDHGHHLGRTKGNLGYRDVDLVHIHFHYPLYSALLQRVKQKWYAPIEPSQALIIPSYHGPSVHLLPYFSMQEWEYWTRIMANVQFYLPAFLNTLREIGEPLVFPLNTRSGNSKPAASRPLIRCLEIDPIDRMDVGNLTQSAMFVPPGTGTASWLKVYLESEEYLRKHPDVRAAGLSAIDHFCLYGYTEPSRVQSVCGKRCHEFSL